MTLAIVSLLLALQGFEAPETSATAQTPRELEAKLRTHVKEYRLEANGVVEALAHVAAEFRIPMGIEWIDEPAARAKLTHYWKNASLREIIEGIAKTQPGYAVQAKNGVVHVFPREVIARRQNFLKLDVDRFDVRDAPLELALRKLRDQVKTTVAARGRPSMRGPTGIAGSLAVNPDDPRITVQLKNAVVEDVIDALAVASARKIWVVTFQQNPTLTRAGLRRTQTLWNDFPIPDDEQPVWDMFRWGDAVPPHKVSP